MLRAALVIARKDLRSTLLRGAPLVQALLLGLLLVFLFSLATHTATQEGASPVWAATVFWLASAFCQTILFNALYSLEEGNAQRLGLLLAPMPVQAVWLGKAVAGFCLLLLLQAIFLVASAVFLREAPAENLALFALSLLLVDVGIAASGSLTGALTRGQGTRESLSGVLLFPLLVPLFLTGVHAAAASYAPGAEFDPAWLAMAAAFDAIFLAAGIVLFPFAYGDDG